MNPATPCALDIERALTTGQAGQRLGVSSSWIKVLIQRGELRAARTGLGWLVDADSVDALAAKRAEVERVS